jgi:hypothetical protein
MIMFPLSGSISKATQGLSVPAADSKTCQLFAIQLVVSVILANLEVKSQSIVVLIDQILVREITLSLKRRVEKARPPPVGA